MAVRTDASLTRRYGAAHASAIHLAVPTAVPPAVATSGDARRRVT
jgi:hypothetical protein